jgi:hypothetical protein
MRTRRSSRKRGHADTQVKWKTRTCGHADMRTRRSSGKRGHADTQFTKLQKSITTIINNFSRDIESYQDRGCVITLTYFFSLFSVLVCKLVYCISLRFLVTETNLAMGHGFICSACKEARFAGNYSLQN